MADKEAYDPGEVWEVLTSGPFKTDERLVEGLAVELVSQCEEAVLHFVEYARDVEDTWAEEVDEHEDAFVEKLARTALNVALAKWRSERKSHG